MIFKKVADIWTKLSHIGVQYSHADEFIQRKIILSNQLGVLGGVIGGIAILITSLTSTVGTAPPTAFAVFYIASIPLWNLFGLINFSRLSLVIVLPISFLAGTLYLKFVNPNAYSVVYFMLPRFTIIASLILAATLLDIRKPLEITLGLLINGLCLLLFDPIHNWLGIGIANAQLELHNYGMVTVLSMAAFMFLAFGYLFLQRLNRKHEQRIIGLYEQMKAANDELMMSEEEIKQNAEELSAINEALSKQNNMVTSQQLLLQEKNTAMLDSLTYARRLQKGFVSKPLQLNRVFPSNFVLDIPRDIVSGDYYLSAKMNGWRMLAVCDCTGHGTAAALMTMVSHTLLQEAYYVLVEEDFWPHEILHKLDGGLIEALEGQEIYDGMDIGLIGYHPDIGIRYAGAHIPLHYLDQDGQLHLQKGAPFSIGYALHNREKKFKTHHIDTKQVKTCYLASDGYQDQFGADDKRRFYSKNFRKQLMDIGLKPMQEQEQQLRNGFYNWKGGNRQFDDVLVVGFSLDEI